jgi:hypothetical protein
VNAPAKLSIALVIVATGYCLASLLGPSQLSSKVSFSSSSLQSDPLGAGHIRLTPDLAPPTGTPPSAVLKGTVVPSPSASNDASVATPTASQQAPLWLSAHSDHVNIPPTQSAPPNEHVATIREDWKADGPLAIGNRQTRNEESREIMPAYFAQGAFTQDPPQVESPEPAGESMAAWYQNLDDDEGAARTHFIVDGDSLSRLAKLYLDDASRWEEIYALNRDQLTNPGLLPIGAELKLPPKAMHGGEQSARASDSLERGLVSVNPTSSTSTDPPEARLLSPQQAKPIYQQEQFTYRD